MNVVAPFEGIGASVRRKEDFRFLQGRGAYTDDFNRQGQLHAWIVRSPHAHARIKAVDTAAAAAMYSASAVEAATVVCRRLDQLMTPPFSRKA